MRKSTPLRSFGFLPMMDSRSPRSEFHFRSRSRSRLNILQFLPEFKGPAQVRNNNGTSHQCGYSHGFVYLLSRKSKVLALSQVISDTIITPENQRASPTDELL